MGVTRKVLRVLMILAIATSLTATIFSLVVLKESKDFQHKMQHESKLFLLEVDGNIEAGFTYVNKDMQPVDLETANQKTEEELLGERYKLFIFEKYSFDDDIKIELESFDVTLGKEDSIRILTADDTLSEFAKAINKSEELVRTAYTSESIKMLLFSRLINQEMLDQGGMMIINLYKQDKLEVYPEGFLFKFINLIPEGYQNKLFAQKV